MTIAGLLAEVRARDVALWSDGDSLRYQGPAGALTTGLRTALEQRKSEILQMLRSPERDTAPGGQAVIRPIPRNGGLPLSYAQQQLWFLWQIEPDSPVYNVHDVTRIGPTLDVASLQSSLDALVDRHEALRTTYELTIDGPVQIINAARPVEIVTVDRSSATAGEVDEELRHLIDIEVRRPFDLTCDPMLRVSLVRLPGEAYVLILVTHHIACDGWSMGMMFRELAALYRGVAEGVEPEIASLQVQYADYAAWQRQNLKGEFLERLVRYWSTRLAGCTPAIDLPADHPRPADATYHGARHDFEIPARLVGPLGVVARREGATPFMSLLAAFAILLHRYTGQLDFNIGSPVAVFNRDELEPLIGLWLNVLVMRADLSADPSYRDLLVQVRETALAAYDHQDLPFIELIEHLRPGRDASRNPLFQVMFVQQLQHVPSRALRGAGLDVAPIGVDNGTAKLDLTLSVAEEEDRFACWFEYNTDIFAPETIARMERHLLTLLESIIAGPETPASRLPLLPRRELTRLLEEWNTSARDAPEAGTIHGLFETQAKQTPDAIAVLDGNRTLSYGELEQRANRLANHLLERTSPDDRLVAICVDRRVDLLIGLLAILKAGKTYVPLDPGYPRDRLAFMLRDAGVGVILTEAAFLEVLPHEARTAVLIDVDEAEIASQPASRPDVDVGSDELAYVIYTSGSTGKPKGVRVPHRAVVNFLVSMATEPGITANDTLLAVTTLAFDIAALELFLPLTVGARVVVLDSATAADGDRLIEAIAHNGATVMQATPATWRMLFDAGWQGRADLKALSGGEALPVDVAAALLAGTKEVWNLYGPTETTIWSTCCRLTSAADPIPIGRPIANTTAYVLDRHRNPVPIGVVGELLIGGAGVTSGYIDRPDLTREKFIPDPFDDAPGARLYCTGDLARFRADGVLEYFGRTDNQVKVRGFRIELGEIETVLREHATIQDAAVIVRDHGRGDARIIGYFVAAPGTSPSTGTELRTFLKRSLPAYMIPNVFVPVPEIPLMPNGKVDRQALPAPDVYQRGGDAFVAPEGEVALSMAAIWQELLGIEQVSANDNFFDLGGHSLLAVRAILLVEQEIGVRLAVRDIVLQTLAQLATSCSEMRAQGES